MDDNAVPQVEINPALAAGINYNLAAAPDSTIVDVVTKRDSHHFNFRDGTTRKLPLRVLQM